MSFEDDEQIVILNDGSSGEKAPTFVAGRIQIEVNNLMEAPPKETRFKVLLELKESGDIEGRHGLDLVMVIDISGSMHEGGKLDKLKIATILVVEKLSPVDRFSVVIFFDSSIRLFPLRQITEDFKAEIIEEIRDLNVKNSDKNIAEGLRMALKVLNDRHFTHGRVGAIMLFSDGAENKGKAAEVDVSKVPVHTFGFDASHDQRVLLEIAQKSNGGTFSDLQNEDNFLSAFSQWLARLLTIVVQDLRVTVKQVDGDSKIMNVLVGNSPIKNENSAVTISYGDLYGKEVRKVQVELLLPNIIGSGPKALDVLQITCSYSDEYGKERFEADPIFITVTRTWGKEIRREEVIEQDAEKKRGSLSFSRGFKRHQRNQEKESTPLEYSSRYKKMSAEHDSLIPTEEQSYEESKIPTEGKAMNTFKELEGITDDEFLNELKEVKVNIRDSQKEVKIQEVPKIMARKGDLKKYFKPTELSIGPIHAADSSLFKKELKRKMAKFFIDKYHKKGADDLFKSFKEDFKDIKTHFYEDIIKSFTDDHLIRLVFLDGCAMLGFIGLSTCGGLTGFDISQREAELIERDLFLMENQIPFTVLHALMSDARCVEDYEWYILEIIYWNSILPKPLWDQVFDHPGNFFGNGNGIKQPDHILDLYRRILLHIPQDSHNCFDSTFGYVFSRLGELISSVMECFDKGTDDPGHTTRRMHSFRNIQELKTAGIKLKPTYSLTSTFFHSRFLTTGQLSIPALVVDDFTERMLLNLVAYEMCLTNEQATDSQAYLENDSKTVNENASWVTSYVKLLDVVIDNEQDVKDLRGAGILQNHLSTDVEVAQLINRIGSNCFPPSEDTYERVMKEIEKHYKRRCAIWMAQVCQSHFSSPWTVLALFAATVVLGLTVVQTYYAVNPKN